MPEGVPIARAFLVLWARDRLKLAAAQGWLGKPLPALYGGPHVSHPSLRKHHVAPGDAVYPVCVSAGRLLLLCRVTVAEVLHVDDLALRQLADGTPRVPWDARAWLSPTCTDDVAVPSASTPLRDDCAMPAELLASIRLVNPKGQERPLKHVKNGRLTHTAGMDGHYYRLSDSTEALFRRLVGGE
jgi:hypothetical protein